ncbi:unnamed protein product, partial [Mycena citricolor]
VVKKAVRAERFLSLDKRRKPKGGTNSAAGTSAAASGNDSREGKKKRFFSRRQNGVIKASAAAVIPPRGNATRPASRPTTSPGSTTAHPRAHENQVDRPWERRLSPQKRAELMARGVCLNCEEAGHMARSCPKLTTMRSKVKGKPPGFGAHGSRALSQWDSGRTERHWSDGRGSTGQKRMRRAGTTRRTWMMMS